MNVPSPPERLWVPLHRVDRDKNFGMSIFLIENFFNVFFCFSDFHRHVLQRLVRKIRFVESLLVLSVVGVELGLSEKVDFARNQTVRSGRHYVASESLFYSAIFVNNFFSRFRKSKPNNIAHFSNRNWKRWDTREFSRRNPERRRWATKIENLSTDARYFGNRKSMFYLLRHFFYNNALFFSDSNFIKNT